MKHLGLPITPAADKAFPAQICLDAFWSPHKAIWLKAYDAYQNHEGNPWKVTPLTVGKGVKSRLYDLYDTRKGSKALKALRQTKLLSCPVCGSPTTGGLDHYLPRTVYPEFSIMRANLVPACSHCNTGEKSSKVKGGKHTRFIHPYFDAWANKPLWLAKPVAPYEAVTFQPKPAFGMPQRRAKIVKFHLENVLGSQFHHSLENMFSALPETLAINIGKAKPKLEDVSNRLQKDLLVAVKNGDVNCWEAAFFRGIIRTPTSMAFLHSRI